MNINIIKKIFGSRNDRLIKRMSKSVNLINSLESSMQSLSDQALAAKTIEYRERLDREEPLDNLLPEAFATVREAARRTLNMRHFDVQLIGGIVLHQGQIAEMRTGEGKTLVATLPVYLNALPGKGVHVITVNDYLARRDAEWMGQIYHFLGLTVGVTIAGLSNEQKRASYSSDVSYGTNNEFGFDYLRDNMAFGVQDRMQRPLHYAIVDEVDSILIDEARTPLIISGPTDDNSDLYRLIDEIVPNLKPQARAPKTDDEVEVPGDFYVDEKGRQVVLSDEGHQHVEELLTKADILKPNSSLYDPANIMLMHHVSAALRAHKLFQRNVDYIVTNNQIVIVDEFTGRTMPGRRWSEGLHQAIEAREGVAIQNENQTLAGITFQNLFRLYKKLSGMTGTADTEAYEFQQIYGLEVVVIPTHHPMIREDKADLVFLTAKEKYRAILEDIRDCRARGQPVLVGTASIENSETLAAMLQQENIPHQVLNAKFHEHEAMIIAQAGRPGAVTIATNMAGRGTDIVLGGNVEGEIKQLGPDLPATEAARLREEWQRRHEAVIKSGGLHIIGTERHESRRIDNQLRGRSGRQGDPGSSRFYLSLEDSLMRIFASERVSGLMQKLGMPEGEAIEHRWVTKAIENAQRKVEGRNFDIRKQLLEYDDIANDQRKIIYEQRSELMESESIADTIKVIRQDVVNDIINAYISPNSLEELWNIPSLETALAEKFLVKLPIARWLQEDSSLHEQSLRQKILEILTESYDLKEKKFGDKVVRHLEKVVMLQVLDTHWKEHLAAMDYLRQGIHLRGIAQKNPKYEFKREAFQMFQTLLEQIKQEVIETLHKVEIRTQEEVAAVEAQEEQRRQAQALQYQHSSLGVFGGAAENMPQDRGDATQSVPRPYVRPERKVGRNELCPCGSGKKFKHCHGKLD